MFTCSKTYSDIPFAHRQHRHAGHCRLIHGHNWSFTFTFGCSELDEKEFVVDFGALGFLKRWIEDQFDHAYVYGRGDEESERILTDYPHLFKALQIEIPSTEGLAQYVFENVKRLLNKEFGDRVTLHSVSVAEDGKNSAEYLP